MNKKVSVIIPIYNVEKYLTKCIKSIIAQTYHNLEIILVDDGSQDQCGSICDNYAEKDLRIKVIHQKNSGLSAARNKGIRAATGEYITFVDSDDYILNSMIEKLVSIAGAQKADIVKCDFARCDENGYIIQNKVKKENKQLEYIGTDKMKIFLEHPNIIGSMAWGKLYKTQLFKGINYADGKYHEDVFTTYKLIHEAKKIVIVNQIGYIYRQNAKSITNEEFSVKRLDLIEGKIQQADFISEEYSQLSYLAYIGIVYACNQCLCQMAKSAYKNKEICNNMQKLYRKYGKYYLQGKVSNRGKCIVFFAIINIEFAKKILSMIL